MSKKVISFALFGKGERNPNCFDYNSYLRGLFLNLRLARLVYPDWQVWVMTDNEFALPVRTEKLCNVLDCSPAPLTQAMLWRLMPLYFDGVERVICRDLDSPLTLREAKCVKAWTDSSKAAHAITDSISHNIPMLGGMVGFDSRHWIERTNTRTWYDLFIHGGFDWSVKGTDQHFLNRIIYPLYATHGTDSIMQHYIKGMPNTFLDGYSDHVPDMGYLEAMSGSNDVCGHIGAAGWYEAPMFKFLQQFKHKFTDILEVERQHPDIFYWVNDGTFD